MVSGIRKRPGSKQVPYLSHEFIIQNHGDIATCLCMVFIVGLMFQVKLFLLLFLLGFALLYYCKLLLLLWLSFFNLK